MDPVNPLEIQGFANVLCQCILPLLEARALASLACACRELRELSYANGASAWAAAAR